MSGDIPEGWAEKPLNDLVDFLDGQRRPIKSADRNHMRGPYPYYGASGIIDWVNDYLFDDDLILLGEDGENILSRNLPLAFAVSGKIWVNNHAHVLRPKAGVDLPFLTQLLEFQDYADLNSGTAQPKLNLQSCKNFKLILPKTLPEQQAIAAALSDADGVVAGLERVIAKKRLIKQGAMQDLLTARRRLPGFSGEWEVKPFAQIARIRNTKVQTLGNTVAQNCIELEQVESETGRILYWADATNRATVKYQFEPDDVLFGRLRPYLRKFHRTNIQGVCSTEIWPLMTQVINGGFLYQVIQSDGFIAAACESYGTHMPRADWGKIATHQIQVPVDRKEQEAIGEVLADMENEIQTLESRLTKARAVKEGMMQNLLTGRVRLV